MGEPQQILLLLGKVLNPETFQVSIGILDSLTLPLQLLDSNVFQLEFLLNIGDKLILIDFYQVESVHLLVHLGFQSLLKDLQLGVPLLEQLPQGGILVQEVGIVLEDGFYFVFEVVS